MRRKMMSGYIESPKISYGRRSKKPLGITIQKLSSGLDDINGYFPLTDDEVDSGAEVCEENYAEKANFLGFTSANEAVSMSSEEELCREERMVRHHEEIQRMTDESIYSDVHDKKSNQSFDSKGRSRCDVNSSVINNTPGSSGHNSNESVFGEILIKEGADHGTPVRQERKSKVMDNVGSHKKKSDFSPSRHLPHKAVAERHMIPKRQSWSNKSLLPSSAKPFSIKKVTPIARRTPYGDTTLYDEEQQKNIDNENLQGKERVNMNCSKEVSDKAPDLGNFGLQQGKQKQKKRSLRNIAVSTDDLSYGSGDDDGNDLKNKDVGNENWYQMNNNEKPTRFIIIERRGPRVDPDDDAKRRRNRHHDSGSRALRGRIFEGRESRQQLLNLKRKSVGLKHQNLSSSEDEAPNQRARSYSNIVKVKTSQRGQKSRRQREKSSDSAIDKKLNEHKKKSVKKMDSNKSLNGSTSKTQLDKKVKKRRGHKLTYHQRKRKCKMEECDVINNKRINQEGLENKSNGKDEKSAKYGANTTASLNYSLQCETPANAPETPRSRSSFVLMPCVESGWVGPSPHPMGATSSHRTFGALPSNSHPSADKRKSKSSKFVLDDNANTLPGGSHSEQESDTARQKNEEIRNEEKPTIVRKRRRCTRVCYPGKRKRKMKVDGPELSSKLHGNNYNEYKVKNPVKQVGSDAIKVAVKDKNNKNKKDRGMSKDSKTQKEKLYANVPSTMMVRDSSDQLVNMNLIFTPAMLRLTAPGKLPDGREFTDFLLHKFFEQRLFNAGRFVLLPMAEKGHQFVQNDTLLFHVMTGEVDFVIESVERRLGPGCDFFVPCGNAYNIKNATQEEAMIFYVQIKG